MKAPTHWGTGSLRSYLCLGSTSHCPGSRGMTCPRTGSRHWGMLWPHTTPSKDAWAQEDGNASCPLEARQRGCLGKHWRGFGQGQVDGYHGLDRCASEQWDLHRFGRSRWGLEETGGELGGGVKGWRSAWLTQRCSAWLKQQLWFLLHFPMAGSAQLPLSPAERHRQSGGVTESNVITAEWWRPDKRGWEKQDKETDERVCNAVEILLYRQKKTVELK